MLRDILQPLDIGVFGPFKHAYGKLVEGMMVAGNNHIDKEDFLHIEIIKPITQYYC